MKRCPTCKRTFTDQNLSFCTEDGTPLATVVDDSSEETLVNPSVSNTGRADGPSAADNQSQPAYQPPGSYVPPSGQPPKRRVWLLVLSILAIGMVALATLATIASVVVPRMLRAAANNNSSNTNVRSYRPDNLNSSSNANTNADSNVNSAEENENDNEENSSAPTSEDAVLAQLTDLENDWTVANLNADKKKLDRILADDYVGKSSEGKPQGKAEYLKTIEPDNTIQKWNFDDLKVSLIGERATLTGIIRLQVKDQELAFNFVDKFVWRDGRWQATGSEVTPINQ